MLQPEVLERVHVDLPASRWMARLHEAGLLADLGELADAPAVAIRSLRADVARLQAVEDRIQLAGQPIAWLVGGVPTAAWVILGGTAVLGWIAGELLWDSGLFGVAVSPIVLGFYGFVGLGYSLWQERRRRQVLAEAEAERGRLGVAIEAAFASILASPFVLRAPGGLVISAPQRLWLVLRLRDLRMAGLGRVLGERMAAELERVDGALRRGDPDALEVDVAGLAREFDSLRVPSGGREGERFDGEVRGPG